MIRLFVFVNLFVALSSCQQSAVDPNSEITGDYQVIRNGIEIAGLKARTTYGSTRLSIRPGQSADEFILSYGPTNLILERRENRFIIVDQGVFVLLSDGTIRKAAIKGHGIVGLNQIEYTYQIAYDDIEYDENGIFLVKAKKI